ncbi:uncharacterized protein LOC141778857 [Sebastes fasciatus]|uniref:uncharacterized protein LOC141778857 n=1 Tax=Sebastes fasciatus TaxID=394691 RepID=UPI003D9E9007
MQPLYYFAFTFLCSLSFLSPVLSNNCSDRQYAWPVNNPHLCCEKCLPGTRNAGRPDKESCDIKCDPCSGKRFTDTYNVEMYCQICKNCDETNMEYRSNCTTTHNAVCGCKDGYRCIDQPCTQCELIPTTTIKTTLPPSTTALIPEAVTTSPSQPIRDTVWFLVIIALLCAGIAIVAVTKIKPFLRWIKFNHGYFWEPAPLCSDSEDGDVSKPIQEVLGKCDV